MDTEEKRIWIVLWVLVIIGALLLIASGGAQAQPAPAATCAPYTELRAALKQRHQEEVSFGLIDQKSVVEIFATPQGEVWTAIMVGSNGTACILATGTEWWQAPILKGAPV